MRDYDKPDPGVIIALSIFAVIVLSGISYCSWYHWPREKPAQVVHAIWSYTHYLHQKTRTHSEEWGKPYGKNVIPGTLSCERRYYGEEDCFCHDVCSGNGSNETCTHHCSSCSVYKDWCKYDHWIWPVIKTANTTGTSVDEPVWPMLAAQPPDQYIEQKPEYLVTFQNDDPSDTKQCTYTAKDYKELHQFIRGEWWRVKTNAGFGVCDPLVLLTAEGG